MILKRSYMPWARGQRRGRVESVEIGRRKRNRLRLWLQLFVYVFAERQRKTATAWEGERAKRLRALCSMPPGRRWNFCIYTYICECGRKSEDAQHILVSDYSW